MLNFIRRFFKKENKKYYRKDLYSIIKLFAIVTYLDKTIKKIEMVETKILMRKIFTKKFTNTNDEEMNKIIKYYYEDVYLKSLKKYQEDEIEFEIEKSGIINFLKENPNKFIEEIIMIIEADSVITKEERQFLSNIKEMIK